MDKVLKIAFWLAVLGAAVRYPNLAGATWCRLERGGSRLARRPATCWIGLGLLVLVARAILLPIWPPPEPVIYDEFGYLLQADTFAAGRLTNPQHPLFAFFESVYILHQPTYNAKYPPGQGLVMALGKWGFGLPWFGVWLSCGALAASLCWALQGWLPPPWALLGGCLAVPLCLFSYWMDSYWGGAVAATGGALVLGSYSRIVRRRRFAYAWLLGLGLVILAFTRMYEGLLFAMPVVLALVWRCRSPRVWVPVAAVLGAGAAFTLHYNAVVTRNPLCLPYVEYQRQYGYVPSFNFLPLSPAKTYRNTAVAEVFLTWEYQQWKSSRSWRLLPERFKGWYRYLATVCQSAPLEMVLLLFLFTTARDRSTRLAFAAMCAVLLGSLAQIVFNPHYAAPATAALLIVLVQSLRHLRHMRVRGVAIGRGLSRAIPAGAFALVLATQGVRLYQQETPEQTQPVNARRSKFEHRLHDRGGRHLIVVRYTGTQSPHEEWVYNRADIDGSEVVWAHDLGAEENRKLLSYYGDRSKWLLQPDINPEELQPYPGP